MDEKPTIRCLIGRPKADGGVRSIRLVSLAAAFLAMHEGWIVIGPDPQDLQRYEQWLTDRGPFNAPRSSP